MAIPKSTQQFYVLTALASLFTVLGVTIAAVTLTQILEESREEETCEVRTDEELSDKLTT